MKNPASEGIHFGAYGPFIVGRRGENVSSDDLKRLWEDVAKRYPGLELQKAKGIYIAAIKRGRNKELHPVYVGKTDTSFKGRLTTKHHLFTLAKEYAPRRLQIFLLARMESEGGSFKFASRKREGDGRGELVQLNSIDRLEFMLIGECVKAGFSLLNTQHRAFHTALNVAGFVGKTTAGDANAAIGVRKLLRSKKQLKDGV